MSIERVPAAQYPTLSPWSGEIKAKGKHDPMVYYMTTQFGAIVNIGTSMNVLTRMKRLKVAQPSAEFQVVAAERGDERLEKERHRQFRQSYHQGEWYWLTSDLIEHIRSLGGAV